MRSISAAVRVVIVLVSIVVFLTHQALARLVIYDRWRRVRWSNRILGLYSHWGLWLLRVKVNVIGFENRQAVRSGLFVGNHLSYLDVLVISSQVPACFVTSVEIRDTPGLGLICRMAGCLFVERRNKLSLRNEVSELRQGLQVGLNVAIFPEATSTNGEQILRFRRPLFVSAIEAGRPVIPFCLNYRKVGGQPISTANRDSVMWYGDMDFMPHLWDLATCGGVEVDIHFQPAIVTELHNDPTQLTGAAQAEVEAVFRPVRPPLT